MYAALCALLFTAAAHPQETRRVLFLGNSYTAANNLPQLTADVAASVGDELLFASNTPGGHTLQGHSSNPTSLNLLMQGNWDHVVLQEQSQLPSFPLTQVEVQVFPYAKLLDSLVHLYNPCGRTLFYMTWGRENGDASNCASWPPVCTYAGMDSLLQLRYLMMAAENAAEVSPVAAVWRHLRTHAPGISLYQGDGSHPSLAGSYAAACCFSTAIFRRDPLLITHDGGLSPADAATIRQAVRTVVYDDPTPWSIGAYDPVAAFEATVSGLSASFTNLSQHASSWTWQFGDGNGATTSDPTHLYAAPGEYAVTLTATHCGRSNSSVQILQAGTTGLDRQAAPRVPQLYPNPAHEQVYLTGGRLERIQLLDVHGRTVLLPWQLVDGTYVIDLRNVASGVHLLTTVVDDRIYSQRLVKY
jgi:hypothetical protein